MFKFLGNIFSGSGDHPESSYAHDRLHGYGPDDDDEGYHDIPDYSGFCPNCPECGIEMRYSNLEREFKCFNCGYTMDEDDWEYEDTSDIPWGCANCGGPYPECKASCPAFDE